MKKYKFDTSATVMVFIILLQELHKLFRKFGSISVGRTFIRRETTSVLMSASRRRRVLRKHSRCEWPRGFIQRFNICERNSIFQSLPNNPIPSFYWKAYVIQNCTVVCPKIFMPKFINTVPQESNYVHLIVWKNP